MVYFGCPWYPVGPVGPFGLLPQRRLPVAQCDFRFNRLAQGAVDLADSLGICRCILGPSAQGESRIWCHSAVCYPVIFHWCGGGVW